jgi:hypothetical protein
VRLCRTLPQRPGAYSEEDLLRSQRTAEMDSARALATAWQQVVLAKGGFTEVE